MLRCCITFSVDGDEIPGIGQYDDFHTIDWQRDIARDRMRHRYIVKKKQDSLWDLIKVSVNTIEWLLILVSCNISNDFRELTMLGPDGCACY